MPRHPKGGDEVFLRSLQGNAKGPTSTSIDRSATFGIQYAQDGGHHLGTSLCEPVHSSSGTKSPFSSSRP